MNELLKEKMYEVVKAVDVEDVGVAFSGGVDSSLLAKLCKDVGKDVKLLTIGFSSQRDIEISIEVSKGLNLFPFQATILLEELEYGLETVLSLIRYERLIRLENCVCFYYIFRLASNYGVHTVLSANGIDELFCGYDVYRKFVSNEGEMKNLILKLVEVAKKDKEEIDKVSALFDIEYSCPFLSDQFIEFAVEIPIGLKIKSEEDKVRKHIVREVALEIDVPKSAALRPKKALQYSSGIHKAIRKLARNLGFTKKYAKNAGYSGEMEAYIESLKTSSVEG